MSSQNEYDALIDQEQAKPAVAPPDKSGHNEYDALLENQQIAASITDAQNVDANPDAAAKADKLSKMMNVPAAAIEHNLPWYEKQAQLQANSKVLQSNPDLQAWVVNNPDKAPQAHDDYENLDYMSKMLYALRSGFNEGSLSTQAGELNALNELIKYRDPNLSKMQEQLNQPQKDFGSLVTGTGIAHALGTFGGSMGVSLARGAEVATAGAVAAPVIGTAAIPLTFGGGFLTDVILSSYGSALNSIRSIRGKDGQPVDETAAQFGAAGAALVSGALMKVGGDEVTNAIASAFSKDVIEEALSRPTITSAIGKAAKTMAVKGGEFSLINLGMTLGNIAAEEFAKSVSAGEFSTIFNDPLRREQVQNQLVDSMEEGLLLGSALHLPPAAKSFYGDVARANETTNNMAMWKNLEQGAQASNLRGRNPEAFQNFLQSQLGDHPAENVYVPAETIAELYQSMNERPGADDRLFPFVKDMKTQLEQGMATGGDVVIPASDYLAHLSGTDIGNHLEQHIKLSPDAMSLKEASEFMKHEKEHFAEFQKQTEAAQQENKVYRDMFNMARGAGYTIDTARQYAALYASRYETRGERLGADPYELFKSNNLKLRTVLPEGLTKEYDNLDMMLNSLRSGKADKPDKAIFGPSLLDFISKRGGIEDTGKDLKAMDLAEWHKGKPGTRKLLREKQQEAGLIPDKEESKYSPDAVTLAAWEAGYFPEHQERPTIKDLHEAIRQELAGKPRFKNRGNINAEEVWQQGINSLEEALHHVGMDVSTHTNKEIKQAFEDAAKALEDGQGYNQGTLVVQHNLTSDNLIHADKIGGIAVPSIAVTKASHPLGNFGEIALIGDKDLIDPKVSAKNKVFGADVYSPRYPTVKYDIEYKNIKALNESLSKYRELTGTRELDDNIRDNGVRELERNGSVMARFLDENGIKPEIKDKSWETESALSKQIRDAELDSEFHEFAKKLFESLEPEEKIFNGFTPSGKRKYLSHDLDTVVKLLTKTIRSGEGFNYGVGSIRAKYTKQFRTLTEIKNHENRLVDKETFNQLKKEIDDAFFEIADKWIEHSDRKNNFGVYDNFSEHLQEAVGSSLSKINKEYYGGSVPEDVLEQTAGFLNKLRDFNTEYFEAKLQRAVDIGEFKGALVPEGKAYEKAVEVLKKHGVNQIERYNSKNPEAFTNEIQKFEKLFFQESRGRINFTDAGAVISLFKDRDLSTLLHESGHLWLEEFVTDAAREDAPVEIRDDYNSLLKYLGVTDASEIGVEQHEKFARAFEAYLMEGKAPSAGLMPVFQKFKSWLVSIYRSLAGLNVEINPEIRGVFDRMLATDREIALAQKAQQLEQLFHTPEDAGMTDAEFSAYTKGVASARDDAQTALLKKVMGDIRRVRTAEWKEEAARIRPEVTSEVDRRQDIGALQFLRGKDVPGLEGIKAPKLSREAIVDMYGNEQAVADMPRGVPPFVVEEGGVHPDYVAEMLGYRSGKEMIDDLLALEAQQRSIRSREGEKRSIRQYLIDEGVNDRMIERHGDMLSDGSIQQEALNVVHNEKQAQVLATELAALSRRTGRTPTPLQIVKQWAAGAIAEKNVRDGTATSRFAAAERKAGKLAEDAMLKGDFEEAFRQKQAQMLNHSLFMESKKARDEVESGVKMLDKYASQKKATNIPQDYLEQIHGLLERFDFKQASQAEIARRTSFREWALEQYDLGNEVVAPDKLLDDSFKKHYTDMTVDEVRGLADTVKNIVHLGRLKKSLLDGKEKAEFDALVTEAVTQLKSQKQLATPDARNPGIGGKGLDKVSAKYLNFKAGLRGLDAAMLKMEQVFDWLDEKNPKGVFNRIVFKRIADAHVTEMNLQHTFAQRMRDISKLVEPDAKAKWLERYSLPELIDSRTGKASSMLKKELIAMALNTGNESNFGKLLEGEGWKREDVLAVLDRVLTKSDWDFVQGVRGMLDKELWPLVEAMEKRVSGIAPPKIEGSPITTKHGVIEGGYYPVVYDPNRSTRAADLGNRSEALFENNYFRATTSKGHTYERVKYAAPILLDLDVLPRHLSQVIHDLAYREAVMDADRFLSDKRVRGAVEGVMGKEYYQQFRPWLKAIANDRTYDSRGLAWWDKMAHIARTNTTMVGLGFRFTTMLMHGATAMSHSIGEIGVKDFLSGVRAFSPGHMTETADFVFSRSGEMKNRMNEIDRDVRDGLKDLEGKTGVVSQARRFAYYGISMLDMASAMPTWVGAYTKALRTMSEEEAVYAADKAVRNAHGGGGIKDQAAIQRGHEWQKLFTMFYSFWNHMYNRQRDIARQAGGIASNLKEGNIGQAAKDFPMVLARSWFYFVVPALIHGAIKANPNQPDDEENWATTAAGEIALAGVSGIPVVRDIANAMHTGRDYSPSPVASMAQSYIKTGEDIGHATGLAEGEVSDKWLKHAIETAGYTTGLPLGQPAQSVQFLWDVQKGEQDPESIQDWLHGLMYGKVGDK